MKKIYKYHSFNIELYITTGHIPIKISKQDNSEITLTCNLKIKEYYDYIDENKNKFYTEENALKHSKKIINKKFIW
jgi:hypothetical protein